jgi:hypothetical protein
MLERLRCRKPRRRTKATHRDERSAVLTKTIGTLLSILILSGFSALRCEATVYHSDGSEASVRACIRSAADGDIVTIPAGTFTWTSALDITKGITLQGQTTITGAGTANPIIKDLTVVLDDIPRRGASAYIIAARMSTGSQSFRLTGVTFAPGTTTTPALTNGPIRLHSDVENRNFRVDHCHFNQLYQTRCIWSSGLAYGVADHNVMIRRNGIGSTEATLISANNNGVWADYPWYGTDKFFFLEDNTIDFGAAVDTTLAGRFVVRHNYLINCVVTNHGTEGGMDRGGRANEVYNNTFNFTQKSHGGAGSQRSGTCLWHDNVVTGTPAKTDGAICAFQNYRETPARAYPVWGIADGTSVWDANDTDGQGHFVEGQPSFVFFSGTAAAPSTISGSQGTIEVSGNPGWSPNQWIGYSIKNDQPKNPPSGGQLGSYIISNDANHITYNYYPSSDTKAHLTFNTGDSFSIHRVLVMMDQNGRGKTDLIIGGATPINSTTGTASYAHSVLEPCYSWNNVYTHTNATLGFTSHFRQPTTKLNIDYFNLGNGFPADTTPSEVSSRYTAALNGVAYTRTFTYPHPLVSGAPTPTPSATPRSQQHLQKKEAKKPKKKKRRGKNQRMTWLSALLVKAIS